MFSVIVNAPVFLAVEFINESSACERKWPEKWMPRAYNVAWFVVMAIIPLTVMAALYSRVVYRLWFQPAENSELNQQQKVWTKKALVFCIFVKIKN